MTGLFSVEVTNWCPQCAKEERFRCVMLINATDHDGRDILAVDASPHGSLAKQMRQRGMRPGLDGWYCVPCTNERWTPAQIEATK